MVKQQDTSLILIVDDHEPAAEMVGHIFRSNGYSPIIANSGREALEKPRKCHPTLFC